MELPVAEDAGPGAVQCFSCGTEVLALSTHGVNGYAPALRLYDEFSGAISTEPVLDVEADIKKHGWVFSIHILRVPSHVSRLRASAHPKPSSIPP
jgi:hypothetical protein